MKILPHDKSIFMEMKRTGFVPILAVFGTAADICDANDGIHVLHEHSSESAEGWLHVDAEASIAVEQRTSFRGSGL